MSKNKTLATETDVLSLFSETTELSHFDVAEDLEARNIECTYKRAAFLLNILYSKRKLKRRMAWLFYRYSLPDNTQKNKKTSDNRRTDDNNG